MTSRAAARSVRVRGARLLVCAVVAGAACKKSSPPPALGETVSVEQPGGSATHLIERGSEIPTSATESFTTLHDGDRRVALHVLRGPGRSADKLRDAGWWIVEGVSAGRAGQARVLVTFEVDAQGAVSVSAREGDHKLRVEKVDDADRTQLAPAPLSDPDEEDEGEDESE